MIHIIFGPTASGKSALAVERAKRDNGVIINADAMQCYAALPILTAQPNKAEQQDIPHHLYGTLPANTFMSAAEWVNMAKIEIERAQSANQTPYVVGGTGMYIKALMQGFSPMPQIPANIRSAVRARQKIEGTQALYDELSTRDPQTAARLKSGDTQRILRALEVFEATGTSITTWQAKPPVAPPPEWQFNVITINPPRDVLEQKITARLHQMLDQGALNEVRTLSHDIDAGLTPPNAPITVAIGYKPFARALKGEITHAEALDQTIIQTRQYTKRQRTWLRNQITANETY